MCTRRRPEADVGMHISLTVGARDASLHRGLVIAPGPLTSNGERSLPRFHDIPGVRAIVVPPIEAVHHLLGCFDYSFNCSSIACKAVGHRHGSRNVPWVWRTDCI
jgi:hypothetical protein